MADKCKICNELIAKIETHKREQDRLWLELKKLVVGKAYIAAVEREIAEHHCGKDMETWPKEKKS